MIQGPPEALEMDLSKEGPDQNLEYGIFAYNQVLKTFVFIQLLGQRLYVMDWACLRRLNIKKY